VAVLAGVRSAHVSVTNTLAGATGALEAAVGGGSGVDAVVHCGVNAGGGGGVPVMAQVLPHLGGGPGMISSSVQAVRISGTIELS
jgi:hypothetical protein